jgi:signal transduction histidine kinase
MDLLPRPRSVLYGQLATAGAALAQLIPFFTSPDFRERNGMLVLMGGALYAVVGVWSYSLFFSTGGRRVWIYFALQCTLIAVVARELNGAVFLALPVVCQAVEAFGWRSSPIVLGLFGLGVWARWATGGAAAGFEALASHGAGFIFAVALTALTGQAMAARERADQLRAALESANAQLLAHAAEVAELAAARERNRIAREIHDGLGHALTVINVQLEAARATRVSAPAESDAALETATRISRDALADVRRSVGALRVDEARPALPRSIQALADDAGVALSLQVHGLVRPLPAEIEHALYRCAQEGITNISKHAAATRAAVLLDFRVASQVALVVSDNGQGRANKNNPSHHGVGLDGIRERIELLGGRVTAANGATGGFVLSIEVPA